MKSARILAGLALGLGLSAAWGEAVKLKGKVEANGEGLFGATVTLVDAGLTVFTDSSGSFDFAGMDANFPLPIGKAPQAPSAFLQPRLSGGLLSLKLREGKLVKVELFGLDGARRGSLLEEKLGSGAHVYRLDQLLQGMRVSAPHVLRVSIGERVSTLKLQPSDLAANATSIRADHNSSLPLAKVAATDKLVISKDGFLRHELDVTDYSAEVNTVTVDACQGKACIEAFIGNGKDLQVAYYKKESDGSHYLFSFGLSDIQADGSVTPKKYNDSKDAQTPSVSPDGKYIAYHIGVSESRTYADSRIYIQEIGGSRIEGPEAPATNPRWHVKDGKTYIVWATAAESNGWWESGSKTRMQEFKNGAMTGEVIELAEGSYNGGLSRDERYLAGGFPRGAMFDRQADSLEIFHAYPGAEPDTEQVCNASISPDPQWPNRFLFLDFGIRQTKDIKPNIVVPKLYLQHQMILIGEFGTNRHGGIVDYIDTPAELKAEGGTWEDPEWVHPDFAIATGRVPRLPQNSTSPFKVPTQENIYLINIKTREYVQIHEGQHLKMPVAYIGD